MENINVDPNAKFLTGLSAEEEADLKEAEAAVGSADLGASGNELDLDVQSGGYVDADIHRKPDMMQ